MNKPSRIIIFLSSTVVFISIFGWYVNPDFVWYERTLARFLGNTLLKIKIFNIGYMFTFNNEFLSDEEIVKNFFTNPQYVSGVLRYISILILASNSLLLLSSLMNSRLLTLFSTITLLSLIVFMSFAINLFIKDEFYPIQTSFAPLLAGSATFLSLLTGLFSHTDK